MEISTSELKRVTLFDIRGRIDSTNAAELGDALNAAIDAGRTQIVLDLSNVEYMSSAGLRELVTALKKVKRGTGDLRWRLPRRACWKCWNWPVSIPFSRFIPTRSKRSAASNHTDERRMGEEHRIVIPGIQDRVPDVCDFVVAAARRAGLNERAIYHCQMAVDEACTNVIEHGFDNAGVAGQNRSPVP
jgi:anti-sigma B factor antagonist